MNSIYPWFKDAWIAIHENEKLPHPLILKGKELLHELCRAD